MYKVLTLLCACSLFFNSCREPDLMTEPAKIDIECLFDFSGDDLATCMTSEGDSTFIFIQKGDGQYALLTVDQKGKESIRINLPNSPDGFLSQAMYIADANHYLLVGSFLGEPAWVHLKKDGTEPLNPQRWNNGNGSLYAATVSGMDWILTGYIEINGDRQVFLSKVDKYMNPVDSVSFGTSSADGGVSLLATNGKILLLCYSYGLAPGNRDFWLMEIDDQLNHQNEQVFGGSGYDEPQSMIEAYGAIYLCGHTTSFGNFSHDAYILCLNPDLSLRWEKNIHMVGHEGADQMAAFGDHQIAFCSYGMLPISGGYYGIIDANGMIIDQKKYDEYERFFQLRAFSKCLMFLGQKKAADLDVSLRLIGL